VVIVYIVGLTRDQVIATLRVHEQELRDRGVLHAGLFGSVARDEAKSTSDIDIPIEPEPNAPVGVFEYVGIAQCLADPFPSRMDRHAHLSNSTVAHRNRIRAPATGRRRATMSLTLLVDVYLLGGEVLATIAVGVGIL